MTLLSAWVYAGVNTLAGIILLPLVLTKFNSAEINVWFLFFSVIGLSEMVVMGFNVTFSRFISYTYAGIHYLDFLSIKSNTKAKKLKDVNNQLSEIYSLNVLIFIAISITYFIILQVFGYYALTKPISYLDNQDSAWHAWQILVIVNSFRVAGYTFPVFLQGMNKMKTFYNIQSFSKMVYILSGIVIMLNNPSLINMAFVIALSILLEIPINYYFFKKANINIVWYHNYNKDLFLVIWDSAWKSGITKIIAPIVYYINGILFAQIATATISATYLLTERIFRILQNISTITINTYLPKIARMRGQNDFTQLFKFLPKVGVLSYGIFVVGYLFVILFGPNILRLMGSNTVLAESNILILFSFAYLLNRIGGLQANLANQANNVIEHKIIIIYGIIYFGVIFVLSKSLSMWVFPFAMILGQLATSLYTFSYSYPMYHTTFWKAEKKSFIPIFGIMMAVNIFYYLN